MEKPQRLVSIDVMRGIVIAFMILVNNNGSRIYHYGQLGHSSWSGWTLTDLVFPSFLLMAGITTVLSTDARLNKGVSRTRILQHSTVRALVLFCLGLIVNGFPKFPWATLRIYGVLQRIAVCYFIVQIVYLLGRKAWSLLALAATCLISYYLLMRFIPVPGFGVPTHDIPLLDPDRNWVAYVDRAIFPHRLYEGVRDPEGLLSDIPAIATACIGGLVGIWLKTKETVQRKLQVLVTTAIALLVAGQVWNIWFPINKKLWTSSYVLFAAGCSLTLLSLCFFLIDVKGLQGRWTKPWLIFGSNAIVAYMVSELLASILEIVHATCSGNTLPLQQCIYNTVFFHLGTPSFGSLLYSLCFVAVCFVPNAFLYSRRLFLKI